MIKLFSIIFLFNSQKTVFSTLSLISKSKFSLFDFGNPKFTKVNNKKTKINTMFLKFLILIFFNTTIIEKELRKNNKTLYKYHQKRGRSYFEEIQILY